MKNKFKKAIYILIMIIILLQYLSVISMAATEISKANLKNDHKITTNLQFKHEDGTWHNVVCNYICYTHNGIKYPAYCIKHGVNGVDEEGPYTVKISELLSDNKIWRTIVNGYPYKTPSQLGVETADDAYVATKQAINSVLLNRDVKSFYRGTNEKGKKIVEAIYKISQIGKNGTQTMQDANLEINQLNELKKYNESYYYQEYKVTSDVNISTYIVNNIKNFPKGSYVSNSSGRETKEFNNNENFRIMIPKKNILKDFTGTVNLTGKCQTYPIFFGEAPKSSVQDYAITYDSYGDFQVTNQFKQKVNNSKITVLKVDKESLQPIEGVTYKLELENGKEIDVQSTDKEGKIVFSNLYPGEYTLKEIKTNEEYILDTKEYKMNIGYGEIIQKTFTNEHKKGNLKIIKVDKDDHDLTLGGIEFELINDNNVVIDKFTTDADGEAYIENINTGTYILRETKTKKEYNLCIDEAITVKWNETSEVMVENEKKKGQIKIVKEDKDDKTIKLANVKFAVLDKNNRIVEEIVTDKNGEAITSKLPIGEYKIKEISLGKNTEYILNDNEYTVNVENNKITNLHLQNEHMKGKLKIIKVDKDNKNIPLENVEFKVIDEDGFTYNVKTNENGIAELENVRTGKVRIEEIKTSNAYVLSKEIYNIEIKYNKTSEITIENEKKKGQIEIYKFDADNEEIKLKGVQFAILDSNYNIVDNMVTNEKGYDISKKIPIGKYYLKEIKTNDKYILKEELIQMEVNENQIIKLNLKNEKKKGQIQIIKLSSMDSPLLEIKKGDVIKGVTFEIYDSNNQLVDKIITNENGQAISRKLEIGRYRIKETNTTEQYLFQTKEFFINIENNNEIKILQIENDPIIPKIEIKKTGQQETSKNQEMAYEFEIKNTGNSMLNQFTWTEYIPYEQVKITKMMTGTYNTNLDYKIYYKTNKKDYCFLQDVSSAINTYIDFTKIKLSKNEVITEIKVEYGTVPVGFETTTLPNILVKVNEKVKPEDTIINRTTLTGEVQGNTLNKEDTWETKITEIKIQKKLPRTGG